MEIKKETYASNHQRLGELVLYIAKKYADNPAFGRVKLVKVFAHADYLAYLRRGASITNERYIKQDFGPVATAFPGVEKVLVDAGRLAYEERSTGDGPQKHATALDEPDTAIFADDDLEIVDEAIRIYWDLKSEESSQRIHAFLPSWSVADKGDDLPYYTVFLSARGPDADERAYGLELARQHGYAAA
jgi:hypothetical protein